MLVRVTIREDAAEHPGCIFNHQFDPIGGDIVTDTLSAIVATHGCANIESVEIGAAVFGRWDIACRLGLNVPGL